MPAKKKAKKAAPRRKKAAKKAKKKVMRKPAKKAKPKPKVKRKPNPAFMKPLQPDMVLAAVVGNRPIPRTQVVKKIWEYIKARGLQDKTNRRMINADDNMMAVFDGKRQVSMFEMTKLVNKHLK
jgi:chromatin remodeling complex protein RSC6